MFRRINLLFWLVAIYQLSFAQVTTNPALPNETKAATITFDATQGTAGLKDFTGDIYAHTGVITDKSTSSSDWKYVIAEWTVNIPKAKLTRVTTNIYTLEITPDILSFYGVPSGETIKQMAFVFRSADGTKEGKATGGKDILVAVYAEGLNVSISSPSNINIFEKNESFSFTASTTISSDLKLYQNNLEIASQSGTTITKNITIPDAGNYWLKVKATQSTTVKLDSVYVCIRESTPTESKPSGLTAGINYTSDQSATLVIYAPEKNYIFVTGDFNDWFPENNFQMKKDGDYFWLKIDNLTPEKEYIFQYLIDGNLKIADPYTDKVSDPYDDQYISSTVYPNLIPYPEGKASDRASVLQTAQTPYSWTTTTYNIPTASKLSIYELLIRDFTADKTYKAVQNKLDYLKRLGINTIELMPFSEFEGNSSWGYNPNFYFAPDKAYGTKNDLKDLIDEAHKQGFIVIQDMVLNHSYNSNPMVKMYWNDALNRPAANNPWFNETSPNTSYSWGSDFNHESQATKDFVDRVTKYWMTEYKVDGFRFDFTKGFTNTPGDGSAYDASRIAILERMADKIWEVNHQAIVILEHFTANTEERELAAHGNGMLIWGNSTGSFYEAAMGYNESGKSDFNLASYQQRGFSKPGLVAYMESHDEERQMFKTLTYGNRLGAYDTKNFSTALERSQLATAFFLSLAGPKMIWQFGELGYDISIDQNGRVGEKPVLWNYLDDTERLKLFNVYSAMLRLRTQFDVFTSGTETLSVNGIVKKIQLHLNDHNITLLGNFGLSDQTIIPNFQHTGTWYDFFTDSELSVSDVNSPILLKAGEYRLYSDQKLPAFHDLATQTSVTLSNSALNIYPNPVSDNLTIETADLIRKVEIYSMDGKMVLQSTHNTNNLKVNLSKLNPGMYFLRVQTSSQLFTEKVVKN
ncbi:MAG TPA: alpha-amylase family glycosyl hydrolase [Prolixibacteraceae bacterium]|nr:alpha-amylase family glycosyl hydrolase [Prolixibacteraceae bacterium]